MELTNIGMKESYNCGSVNDYLSMSGVSNTYKNKYLLEYDKGMDKDKWLSFQTFYTRLSVEDLFRLILISVQVDTDYDNTLSDFYNSVTRLISKTKDEERNQMLKDLSSLIRRSGKFITLINDCIDNNQDIDVDELCNGCNLMYYIELSLIEMLKNTRAKPMVDCIRFQNSKLDIQKINDSLLFLGKIEDEILYNNDHNGKIIGF